MAVEDEGKKKNEHQPNRYPMTNRERVSTDYFIMFTSTHCIQSSSCFFFSIVYALTSRQNTEQFFVQFELHAAPHRVLGALRLFVYVNSTK